MKKRAFIILLLILLIACQRKDTTPTPQTYRSGNQGLALSFAPNLPPPTIIAEQREPLQILVNVENRGTSTVGGGQDRLYLHGFDPNIITGISTQGQPIRVLEGRGPYVQRGEFDTISFRARVTLPEGVDRIQQPIYATACYTYETVATGQVCIDPNPFSPYAQQKVCTPSAINLGSQGAPVAVQNVNVIAQPGRTRFEITISNVGGGTVFDPNKIAQCNPNSPGLGPNDIDRVLVEEVSVSGQNIIDTCKPRLREQRGLFPLQSRTITCELEDIRGESAYITPITVKLRYGYKTTIPKIVTVISST
ncbi:hypothetical protein D6825_01055 [Candidatus Woesearchaeota archaeon]|nr:MAG: hypothetical protein D6825_01055 [Candidatus Woesearchaeota archaeon]